MPKVRSISGVFSQAKRGGGRAPVRQGRVAHRGSPRLPPTPAPPRAPPPPPPAAASRAPPPGRPPGGGGAPPPRPGGRPGGGGRRAPPPPVGGELKTWPKGGNARSLDPRLLAVDGDDPRLDLGEGPGEAL